MKYIRQSGRLPKFSSSNIFIPPEPHPFSIAVCLGLWCGCRRRQGERAPMSRSYTTSAVPEGYRPPYWETANLSAAPSRYTVARPGRASLARAGPCRPPGQLVTCGVSSRQRGRRGVDRTPRPRSRPFRVCSPSAGYPESRPPPRSSPSRRNPAARRSPATPYFRRIEFDAFSGARACRRWRHSVHTLWLRCFVAAYPRCLLYPSLLRGKSAFRLARAAGCGRPSLRLGAVVSGVDGTGPQTGDRPRRSTVAGRAAACRQRRIGDCKIGAGHWHARNQSLTTPFPTRVSGAKLLLRADHAARERERERSGWVEGGG